MTVDFTGICHSECGSASFQLRSIDRDATTPGFPSNGDRVDGDSRSVHVADKQVDLSVRWPREVACVEPGLKVDDLIGICRQITQKPLASGFCSAPERP